MAWSIFERLVKSTKTLLRKQLEKNKLNYEELQTVLCEVETILNNRPLAYYYSDNTEQCLKPNHLLFGRTVKLFDPEPTDITHDKNFHSKKISNITNHFWNDAAMGIRKKNTTAILFLLLPALQRQKNFKHGNYLKQLLFCFLLLDCFYTYLFVFYLCFKSYYFINHKYIR